MVVLMTDQDSFARPSHSILCIVFFESLESRENRWIFFRLMLFCSECVVTERVESNRLWLIRIEGRREDRWVLALLSCLRDCGHICGRPPAVLIW